jgi:hypothetical protein
MKISKRKLQQIIVQEARRIRLSENDVPKVSVADVESLIKDLMRLRDTIETNAKDALRLIVKLNPRWDGSDIDKKLSRILDQSKEENFGWFAEIGKATGMMHSNKTYSLDNLIDDLIEVEDKIKDIEDNEFYDF